MLWLLLLLCAAAGGMTVFLFRKASRSTRESTELRRLREAHEQLDHQAKLIIRTDLELHRAQAELDRRLASLMSLHQLARRLQVSLRPEEVYRQLEPRVVGDFGFTKALLGMSLAFDQLEWASRVGLDAPHGERIKAHLLQQDLLRRVLTNPAPRTLTAVSAADDAERALLDLLGTSTVVLAGVIPSPGPAGCLLLARDAGGAANPKAEEELVGLLTNALVAAIENSALYEESWASQRQLEQKVQERTQELARANAELMRLNKAKSDFVSAVSHELRTPLAAIKGYAALLATGQFGPMVAPQTERLTKIQKHVDTLTQLINDLLDIARIEAGRVLMEPRSILAEEFLASTQDFVRPQLDAKHLRFTLDLDGVSHLMGDPQHLQRVFVNLLSNAIKYTPEGGTIRVGLRREGEEVIVTVSDTGCGIPPQDLPKLFQEFVRSSDPVNRQVPGTGLGLTLVKRIVEAHQGRVAIASEPGHGTTVTVRLPLVHVEPPDTAP